MARIEEGGIFTQKVKALGVVAIMLMAATCLCFVATDDDTDAMNVDGEVTYIKTGESTTFTLTDHESALYYVAEFLNSNGVAPDSAISSSYASGQLTNSGDIYKKEIPVTCPSEADTYRMHVTFYKDSEKQEKCGEKSVPLKVVDPIVLTVTLNYTGNTDLEFKAYFKINGAKVDDSEQTVTVSAGSTQDVTYDYVVDSPSQTTYSLCTDDTTVSSVVSGLDTEKTFYTSQNDPTVTVILAVVVIIALVVALILILRKPVVNRGKPKGRR